jgi:hypothetical protein
MRRRDDLRSVRCGVRVRREGGEDWVNGLSGGRFRIGILLGLELRSKRKGRRIDHLCEKNRIFCLRMSGYWWKWTRLLRLDEHCLAQEVSHCYDLIWETLRDGRLWEAFCRLQ